MIRLADIPDVKPILEIADELWALSAYSDIKIDRPKCQLALANMIGNKNCIVYVVVDGEDNPQGFFIGCVEELFFSREKYASDICIYVRKGYRKNAPAMIKSFVAWAKAKKVKDITLGISSGMDDKGRTGKMYEALGFGHIGGMYRMGFK